MAQDNKNHKKIRLGVSSCLLGEKVRFDGGHKKDPFLTEFLSPYVEWVPVCPEIEMGLGIPRDSLHLEIQKNHIHLVESKSGKDLTSVMNAYAQKRIQKIKSENLSGYILKKNSPSCGMERVKLYAPRKLGIPLKKGVGVFADTLMREMSCLPIEEEGRLQDPLLRENFIERIFAYQELQDLFNSKWKLSDLIRFHTQHKLTLLAHSPKLYQVLGRHVANAKNIDRKTLKDLYSVEFMHALKQIATRARHGNVLLHILGYFKKSLDPLSRQELLSCVEAYRKGTLPLIVPMTLIQYFAKKEGVDYLLQQTYLNPHPQELMLRNHV